MGPPRKIGKIWAIFGFFRPTEKMAPEGPKWGGDASFRHKKTLPTFWAERILILRIFDFWIFLGSQISGLGPLGPTHLGPAWAHPLGPSLGPPTWAQRGPTHLGPACLGPGAAGAAACAAGRILRSQPDPSPNAPRDEIRRKDPCCDLISEVWAHIE